MKGISVEDIRLAYIMAEATGKSPGLFISEDGSVAKVTASISREEKELIVKSVQSNVSSITASDGAERITDYDLEISIVTESEAYTTTLSELNAAAGIYTSYQTMSGGAGETADIQPPFYLSLDAESAVSLNNGAAVYEKTLFSMDARGDGDYSLTLKYNSHNSWTGYYYEYVWVYYVYYYTIIYYQSGNGEWYSYMEYWQYYYPSSYEDAVDFYNYILDYVYFYYDDTIEYWFVETCDEAYLDTDYTFDWVNNDDYIFARGWSFDLPRLTFRDGVVSTFYIPGSGSYELHYSISSGYSVKYNSSRIIFTWDISYYTTFNDRSYYKAVFKDGTVYYFDGYGNCLARVDKYGNYIEYTYDSFNNYRLTDTTDSLGRDVSLSYTGTGSNLLITVTLPNSETVEINYSGSGVTAITDQLGGETSFSYTNEEYHFDYPFESGYMFADYSYYLLTGIQYQTGAVAEFTYSQNSPDLFELWNISGGAVVTGYSITDGIYEYSNYEFEYNIGGNSYTTNVIYPDGRETFYYFDYENYNYKIEETAAGGIASWRTTTKTYNGNRLITSIAVDYDDYGNSTTTETYTYDAYHNLLTYTNARGLKTTYTYDYVTNHYNMPLTKTVSYDILEEGIPITHLVSYTAYTLTQDYKGIASEAVYSVGAVFTYYELERTTYTYDAYGNVTAINRYTDLSGAGTYITTSFDYTDSDTLRGYDSAFLASVTTTGVLDADGSYFDGSTGAVAEYYEYTDYGQVSAYYDANGNKTAYAYDLLGAVTDITKYTWNAINSEYSLYSTETYTYDREENTVTHTNVLGGELIYDYNGIGLLETVTRKAQTLLDSDVIIESYVYDELGRVIEAYNAQGETSSNKTVYTYDERGELEDTKLYGYIGATPVLEAHTYTEWVNRLAGVYRIVQDGLTTSDDYYEEYYTNNYGDLTQLRKYYGTTTSLNGQILNYTYDVFGRTVTEGYANGSGGNVISALYAYDYRGNVVSTTNVFSDEATAEYDKLGRLISETDYNGNTTNYTYDALGRQIKVTVPIDSANNICSVSKTYYDAVGNVIRTKQSNNPDNSATLTFNEKNYTYDALNRLTDIEVKASASSSDYTHYTYNEAGNITAMYTGMTSPHSILMLPFAYQLTQYEYDKFGLLLTLIDQLGNDETYEYDKNGYLEKETLRNDYYNVYAYNGRGLVLTNTVYSPWHTYQLITASTYDALGRKLTLGEMSQTIYYEYDNGPNLTYTNEASHVHKMYEYDRNGNRAYFGFVIGYANAHYIQQEYIYDAAFRLVELIDYDPYYSSVLSDTYYSYDDNGNLLEETTTGVTKSLYGYNEANLVTSVENYSYIDSDWSLISSFEYTYYTDGNQRTKYDSTRSITTTYTYDGAGRLLTEIEILGGNLYQSYTYTYDHAGNRLTLTAEGNSELCTEHTYNAANQLIVEETTVGEDTTVIEYAYDVRGCLATKTTDSVVTDTYAFDERARLIVYTGAEGSFVYYNLPDNRRYTKKYGPSSDDRIRYIFDGDILIYEGEFTAMRIGTIYVHGLNLISSKYRTINSESSPMQLIAFYVQNAHGDVVQLLDPTDNTVTKSYIYDAFGNELDPSPTDTNYFRYCGEYYDTERGEYYLRARYYDPRTGRFTQQDTHWNVSNMLYGDNPLRINNRKDPLGLNVYTYVPDIRAVQQSGNLYVYCINNPIAYVDLSGNFIITTAVLLIVGCATILGTVGGIVGNHVANKQGATGWEKVGYIAGGVVIGAAIGAAVGAAVAPAVISATGVAGISVTSAGITTVAAGGGTGVAVVATQIAPELQRLYEKTVDHIFSAAHKAAGIMNLGSNQIDIFNKITNIANQYSSKWASGSNEIRTVINGIETTIRFYVQNGTIINIDAFVGYSERIIGNLIK